MQAMKQFIFSLNHARPQVNGRHCFRCNWATEFVILAAQTPTSNNLRRRPPNDFLIRSPTSSSFPHSIGLFAPIITPTFSTLTTSFSFRNWSPNKGHVSIGTPAHIASKLEFQPQCVKNPPIEGCDSISS
ncbi:hypothetical protein Ahy_B10g105522 [Arachis hypogaea]|uniref:Uncharacterized protein n=1 Tax=Arachis hypogaea TaxID=3818 RepID=A0A444X8B5_ARAHY|nr:hypothetical protein Ahy_B10g105522 [Arachis hypogaea]